MKLFRNVSEGGEGKYKDIEARHKFSSLKRVVELPSPTGLHLPAVCLYLSAVCLHLLSVC